MSALIGIRAAQFVKKQYKLNTAKITTWTNAKWVLLWLNTKHKLTRFLQNRIDKVKQANAIFRHVLTSENPADIVTRRNLATELQNNQLS